MTIRSLQTDEELQQVLHIEQNVWRHGHSTPVSLLRVFADHGGLILGAYDEEHNMIAMSAAFPARYHGLWYLHSHMMAVLPPYRSQGIGRQMKSYQLKWALDQGYEFVGWTFDPLQRRNAQLNLGILKARVLEFYPNYYGVLHDAINGAWPTHRFFVGLNPNWPATSNKTAKKLIPIPENIAVLRQQDPSKAMWWAEYYVTQFSQDAFSVLGLARSPQGRLCYVCSDKPRLGETRETRRG
ncbi:GNAT family N-acetyltransferase [Sulfobacillus thermosulfidooxidans]|uniref:GNAT family N-acetyltransferase n=1 Tax=Sulfobacillus thermosulfidooxidans TaxID=28034 RepID=UPI001494722F|nr:GNAT family N-acetyltransferase [Sulfobacillus thermosulfidooxidans]